MKKVRRAHQCAKLESTKRKFSRRAQYKTAWIRCGRKHIFSVSKETIYIFPQIIYSLNE